MLITRLDSIEDAASIDVLCLDKTGTITENKLSVAEVTPFAGHTREDVILNACLASQEVGQDTIDLAVIAYAKESGIDFARYKQVSFTPFEPSTKNPKLSSLQMVNNLKLLKVHPR